MHNYMPDRPMDMRHRGAIAFVLTLTTLLFWRCVHAPFFFNDISSLLTSSVVTSLETFYERMITFNGLFARPLSVFTFALNYEFFKTNSIFYHLTNLLLHVVNVFIFYFVARRWVRFVFIPTAIFAVHPLATAVVVKIFGRSYSLGTTFLLLATFFLQKWFFTKSLNTKRGMLVGLFFALMVFSKQSFIFFLMIALWHFIAFEWKPKEIMMQIKKHSFLFFSGIGIALFFLVMHGARYSRDAHMSASKFLMSQLANIPKIFEFYFIPKDIAIYNKLPVFDSFWHFQVILGAIIAAALIYCAVRFRKNSFWFFVGLTIISFVPTNSVIPKNEVFYDWRVYPSLVFFSISLGLLFDLMHEKLAQQTKFPKLVVGVAGALYVGLLAYKTHLQMDIYTSADATYKSAFELYPDAYVINAAYGWHLLEAGKFEEALPYLHTAHKISPRNKGVISNLIYGYTHLGNHEEAAKFNSLLRSGN